MTPTPDHPRRTLLQSPFPWLVILLSFALYIFTLNPWISFGSLPAVSRVSGWEWSPIWQTPLLQLLGYPFRALPAAWQPYALNTFAAACAAAALGFLARSVILLPHDRTRDQRHLMEGEPALLNVRANWLPPLLAALVCGLQLSFWEHATAFTGEMLDLALFAYLIRCLLEFRIDGRQVWLSKLAFVYGLAVTNNWAMIAYFPAFLGALIWIRGRSFFAAGFVLRTAAWGIAGLSLYLLLPLIGTFGDTPYTFGQLLRTQVSTQKNVLLLFPKYITMICGFTSLVPLLLIGIRWPSTSGDTSSAGAATTDLMLRIVHLSLLVACVWVMFDPRFSPRTLGLGVPMLTFYYLSALCVGYFSGYGLLVFGEQDQRPWKRPTPLERLTKRALTTAIWATLIVAPLALLAKNLGVIRFTNGPVTREFARAKAAGLPTAGAVVLSDDDLTIRLVDAALRAEGTAKNFLLLQTRVLSYKVYHDHLLKKYPGRWPDLAEDRTKSFPLDSPANMQLLANLAQSNRIYYLHPSFGYYFEIFHLQPHGMVYELKPYTNLSATQPVLSQDAAQANYQFWLEREPMLKQLATFEDNRNFSLSVLQRAYSIALNYCGVELQRAGQLTNAAALFALASQQSDDNVAATINLEVNRNLQHGKSAGVVFEKNVEDKFGRYRSWDSFLGANGPTDEPSMMARLAQSLLKNSQPRQAASLIERIHQLDPKNLEKRIALAGAFLQAQAHDRVFQTVADIRNLGVPLSVTQQIELVRLEAWAKFRNGDIADAEKILRNAQPKFPQQDALHEALSQIYLLTGRYPDALKSMDEELKLNPNNIRTLLNQGAVNIQIKAFAKAIPPLDRILELEPGNTAARMNRAIAQLQLGNLDAAKADYEILLGAVPGMFSVHYGLGEIAWRQTNLTTALKHYQSFLKTAPTNADESTVVRQRVADIERKRAKKP